MKISLGVTAFAVCLTIGGTSAMAAPGGNGKPQKNNFAQRGVVKDDADTSIGILLSPARSDGEPSLGLMPYTDVYGDSRQLVFGFSFGGFENLSGSWRLVFDRDNCTGNAFWDFDGQAPIPDAYGDGVFVAGNALWALDRKPSVDTLADIVMAESYQAASGICSDIPTGTHDSGIRAKQIVSDYRALYKAPLQLVFE